MDVTVKPMEIGSRISFTSKFRNAYEGYIVSVDKEKIKTLLGEQHVATFRWTEVSNIELPESSAVASDSVIFQLKTPSVNQALQCPVCRLYLLSGMSLQDHLNTHPRRLIAESSSSANLGFIKPVPKTKKCEIKKQDKTDPLSTELKSLYDWMNNNQFKCFDEPVVSYDLMGECKKDSNHSQTSIKSEEAGPSNPLTAKPEKRTPYNFERSTRTRPAPLCKKDKFLDNFTFY